MDTLHEMALLLQDLGIELPTPAYLIGILLFGVLGIVVFVLGRRRRKPRVKWVGLALMLYPYVVWSTAPLYVVGLLLCGLAYWFWRQPSTGG
jgi:hypothetical protein